MSPSLLVVVVVAAVVVAIAVTIVVAMFAGHPVVGAPKPLGSELTSVFGARAKAEGACGADLGTGLASPSLDVAWRGAASWN